MLLVLGGLLLFVDTLLAWQAVTVAKLTYSRNAWHGFWGGILGLMSIAFLINASAQADIVEFRFRLPYRVFSIVLAPAILVFAVIKTIKDDHSAWASYAGIVLAGVVVCAAWLSWRETPAEKPVDKVAAESPQKEGTADLNQRVGSLPRDLTPSIDALMIGPLLSQEEAEKMAASDELFKLAVRAKEAEDRVAAARSKAKSDLEKEVDQAAADAQATAEKLRQSADANEGKVSDWWKNAQSDWNKHIATARANIESKKAELDIGTAQANADLAENDARFAVDFALGAIEEAEYAVLDAALAKMQLDELVAASG